MFYSVKNVTEITARFHIWYAREEARDLIQILDNMIVKGGCGTFEVLDRKGNSSNIKIMVKSIQVPELLENLLVFGYDAEQVSEENLLLVFGE